MLCGILLRVMLVIYRGLCSRTSATISAQSTPILHLCLEELVKLVLGRLVQLLDAFSQIKGIIVLRVQLAV